MEPITGTLSRDSQFDLDNNGVVDDDERRLFNALNLQHDGPIGFLTYGDMPLVRESFGAEQQRAVDRLIVASEHYRRLHAGTPNTWGNMLTRGMLETKAQDAARLAHAFSPPGSAFRMRARAQLEAVKAEPGWRDR